MINHQSKAFSKRDKVVTFGMIQGRCVAYKIILEYISVMMTDITSVRIILLLAVVDWNRSYI